MDRIVFENVDSLIEWISNQKRIVPKVSLDKMRQLCEIYGNPHEGMKYVHVGGTNGKGSTVSFLKSILVKAGYNVGAYISPFVISFHERISVNHQFISDEDLLSIGQEIVTKYPLLDEREILPPTFFEFVTLLAFMYFRKQKELDIVLCEVGIGGLLDSTNVITPLASVITNVHYDHMNVLGNTLEEIAINKLGIVKEKIPLFTIENPTLNHLFLERTKKMDSKLQVVHFDQLINKSVGALHTTFTYKNFQNIQLGLLGQHQMENASLAIEVIEYLCENQGFLISKQHILEGLRDTFWPGRLQILRKEPLVLVDGAHNIDGIRRLVEFIKSINLKKPIRIVFAVSHDKSKSEMIQMLEEIADEMVFTHFAYRRSDDALNLYDLSHHPNKRVEDDLDTILHECEVEKDMVIVFCGSLYFASDILHKFKG